MDIKQRIRQLASDYARDIVSNRQHLHQHPELSFQEVNTSRFVYDKLKEYGLDPQRGIAGTGIVVLIEGRDPAKNVLALRADMDALPITEQNDVPYRSVNQGVMHACGHDVHTASLLGTARILNHLREEFEGTVKLIFQPGEEKAPGGASKMIEEGVLQDPAPGAILGQHVMPQIPVGKVGFKPGIYMASADEIYITIKGRGGHAAMPDTLVDPVLIASYVIVALQQIVSRNANPKIPSVLSFGKIIANGATNVIPDEVNIEGTFRTLDETWRMAAHEKMKKIGESVARGMGASIDFNVLKGYPFLHNDERLTHRCRDFAVDYLGKDRVVDLDIWMAAEDFAFYSQHIDACFYRLGVGNPEKGITSSVHTPTFNVDEDSLETGAGLMAYLTCSYLQEMKKK